MVDGCRWYNMRPLPWQTFALGLPCLCNDDSNDDDNFDEDDNLYDDDNFYHDFNDDGDLMMLLQ